MLGGAPAARAVLSAVWCEARLRSDISSMRLRGTLWAIPLLCLGLGLLACAVLIPAADQSRQLARQKAELVREVSRLQAQGDRNAEFLHRLGRDKELSEVLIERQLGQLPDGVAQVSLSVSPSGFAASPFAMLELPEPPPLPPAATIGGQLTRWCLTGRTQTWILAAAILLTAAGLLLGSAPKPER